MSTVLKYQIWHILGLAVLLYVVYFLVSIDHALLTGSLLGWSTRNWMILTLTIPVAHQIYVLLIWRLQWHHQWITDRWGRSGFTFYKFCFVLLLLSRPVTVTLLAMANGGTLDIDPISAYVAAGILAVPIGWLLYSVKTYFGLDRAVGMDHFFPEEVVNKPLVRQGIFRYTDNGMYLVGFLILYIPVLLFRSETALLAAVFQHMYIWIHYFTVEKPDMNVIYRHHAKSL